MLLILYSKLREWVGMVITHGKAISIYLGWSGNTIHVVLTKGDPFFSYDFIF